LVGITRRATLYDAKKRADGQLARISRAGDAGNDDSMVQR